MRRNAWLPWKYVVRRAARARGFVDPITVLARMHQFAEPAEVAAPIELLRAGVVFHARGLMNASAIQHNRDWIWPYWVERQFDPKDVAFLPRAFSVTHVNLTHRNWTAIGLPGCDHLPIVDPRGLLTPFWDSWSIDGWIFENNGDRLIPARQRAVEQHVSTVGNLAVTTICQHGGSRLQSVAEVVAREPEGTFVRQHWQAVSQNPAWLVLSVRPYNPEGVSFVHTIRLDDDARGWQIGDHGQVRFSVPSDQHFTSDYKHGDVAALVWTEGANSVECPVGMATAAAAFRLEPETARELTIEVPLDQHHDRHHWTFGHTPRKTSPRRSASRSSQAACSVDAAHVWDAERERLARLSVPDERLCYLHEVALRSVILHTPGEVYPGPFTYKRFWVRDTAFILNAALCVGLIDRTTHALPHLLKRQNMSGYFRSQDGEWDANGQALWLLDRYLQLTNRPVPSEWKSVIRKAAHWIRRKRVAPSDKAVAAGLLPAGFSAEHLGPNDYYYWDDFWSIAGLDAAARLARQSREPSEASTWEKTADELRSAIDRSLQRTDYMRGSLAYPAAPERRMDAGAIGSLVATYPLQLVPTDDKRMCGTIDFLLENCMVDGGFFQDMIHSGINPYLTLHIAQALLRGGDSRFFDLVNTVAKLASPTGQWPEAIHPATLGGCMGDGQHVWAAAEWLMAIRNMFVREERGALVIGAGIPAHWHYDEETLAYGPTWTPWGTLQVHLDFSHDQLKLGWEAVWHRKPPRSQIAVPCFQKSDVDMSSRQGEMTLLASHATGNSVSTTV